MWRATYVRPCRVQRVCDERGLVLLEGPREVPRAREVDPFPHQPLRLLVTGASTPRLPPSTQALLLAYVLADRH